MLWWKRETTRPYEWEGELDPEELSPNFTRNRFLETRYAMITNSIFLISISLEPDEANLYYFKL